MICAVLAARALGGLKAAAAGQFRLAICNETFANLTFAEACRAAAACGYAGLEIAPFTLAEEPATISPAKRTELRDVMRSEDLGYVGLHSLLTAPKNLNVVADDRATRRRSWEHLRRLIDLSADLAGAGAESVMVFGSGKQRTAPAGVTVRDALGRFRDGLAALAPAAEAARVRVLIEPLSPQFTNVVNTLGEAAEIVRAVNSPAIRTMFDTHNSVAESIDHGALIKKYRRLIRHIHLNEMDGRHPGTGAYDFKKVLQALKDVAYGEWVSIEVFDFSPGGEKIARESSTFVRQVESSLR